MRSSRLAAAASEVRRARRLLEGGIGLVALFGLVWADSPERLAAYTVITGAAVLPLALWLRTGMPGIPVLPAVASFHYLYFAVPILRENVGQTAVEPSDILRAAFTVALFLSVAALAWELIVGSTIRRSRSAAIDFSSRAQTVRLMFCGIAIGALFQLAAVSGWLSWLGAYYGIVRSVSLTVASIACYLLGYCRARGMVRGQVWGLALAGIGAMLLLSWSSLFLVGGMIYALAAGLGYVITSGRVPGKTVGLAVLVVFVLHAGKFEMRDRYWTGGFGQSVSITQIPGRMIEWVGDGLVAIAAGNINQDLLDRASLLSMLLLVERRTPDEIPYLGGETYALLPSYLVPRFLDPDKTFSQAGLALLNLRYGIQTREGLRTTTIGWGIISEAFANFGYIGVLGAGLLFGALCAWFTRLSVGEPALALPTLLSVAALVTMINLEADFAFLLTNLWQALAATLIFFAPLKYLSGGEKPRPTARVLAASRQAQPS